MVLRRALPVAVLLLLNPRPGLALDYEVAGRASVGVTDNALAAPSGTPGSGWDALLTLRGEAALVWLRKYMEHKLAYLFTLDTYLDSSAGETVGNALRWEAAYAPLSWLHISTDFMATQGTLSSVDTMTSSGRAGILTVPSGPRPAAPLRFLTLDGRQGASVIFGPDWRLVQGLSVQAFWPLQGDSGRASSQAGDVSLGLERTFERSGISLSAHAMVNRASEVVTDGAVVEPYRRSYVAESMLGWRHTYSPAWSHFLAAGALAAWVPAGSSVRWKPSGRVDILAADAGRELVISGERSASADVYVGDIFLSTRGSVAAGQILDGPRRYGFRVLGSFNYSQALERDGGDRGSAKTWDVRSVFSLVVKRPIRLTFEYAFTYQSATHPPLPSPDVLPPFSSFHRNLFLVGAEIRYSTFPAPDGSDRELRGPSDELSGDPRADLDHRKNPRP